MREEFLYQQEIAIRSGQVYAGWGDEVSKHMAEEEGISQGDWTDA